MDLVKKKQRLVQAFLDEDLVKEVDKVRRKYKITIKKCVELGLREFLKRAGK